MCICLPFHTIFERFETIIELIPIIIRIMIDIGCIRTEMIKFALNAIDKVALQNKLIAMAISIVVIYCSLYINIYGRTDAVNNRQHKAINNKEL